MPSAAMGTGSWSRRLVSDARVALRVAPAEASAMVRGRRGWWIFSSSSSLGGGGFSTSIVII